MWVQAVINGNSSSDFGIYFTLLYNYTGRYKVWQQLNTYLENGFSEILEIFNCCHTL
jgi:hypothetical protein